jgi:EAL domain-containing protein (putative c-di-GMP-specific phosphodiesterase class I)
MPSEKSPDLFIGSARLHARQPPAMFAPPGNVALYFQPLVNLSARRIIGFTAHSARPGDEVLRAACRAAARWPDGITLGVEISPTRWLNPAVGLQIFSALSESGLSPSRIELEIAVDALVRDTHAMLQTIERVRHSGIMVALTGCGRDAETVAPISCFDTLKFGQTLVQRLGHHAQSDMIADTLIRVADQYGVVTAADGISTEAQADILNAKGCAEGQGGLFGNAVRASDIPALLRYPALAEAGGVSSG